MLLKKKKYNIGVIFHEKEKDVVKWVYEVKGSNVFWATYEELHRNGAQPIQYSYRIAMEDLEALTINGYVAFITIDTRG